MASRMVHVRMDEELKAESESAFHSMGLSMSEAFRMFCKQVVSSQMSASQASNTKQTLDWSRLANILPKPKRSYFLEEIDKIMGKELAKKYSK